MLSEALPVVPTKLVRKVEKGEFVDMADFLKDNIEAERRRIPTGDSGMSGLPQVSRREVPDILSWLHSFNMFAAIVSSKYPHKAWELWAYQATIMIGG